MNASTQWILGASCAREGLRDLPWTSENTTALDRARMARVCAACPVLAACAVSVATTETTAGFWAGHDRTEPDLPEQPAFAGLDTLDVLVTARKAA